MNMAVSSLAAHTVFEKMHPARRRLVRLAAPLSPTLNPFANDNVELRPAILYDSTFNSKAHVAYQLFAERIKAGEITPNTSVCVPSSGNTGLGAAQICKALGIPCEIVMQVDTPASKVGVISALGYPISIKQLSSGTVAYAREKAKEKNWVTIDQYAEEANIQAHQHYLAPQLWQAGVHIDVLVVPGGTLGTASGLQNWARMYGKRTRVIVAVCADGEEVPGARDRIRIKKDVKIAKLEDFEHVMSATRAQSFLASYAMFSDLEWTQGGPTSGLALSVALRFIQKSKGEGTLDRMRSSDGKLRVVFMCPDPYLLYGDLYRSTLNEQRDFERSSVSMERLLD